MMEKACPGLSLGGGAGGASLKERLPLHLTLHEGSLLGGLTLKHKLLH